MKTAVADYVEKSFGAGGKITVSVDTRTVTTGYGTSESDTQVVAIVATREIEPT